MDHRYRQRTPVRLTVNVFKRNRFLGRFISRNMDVEGIFVQMPAADLEVNDVVKLSFLVHGLEPDKTTILAGVVRLDSDGAGMMLFDCQHKALDILRAADPSDQVQYRRMDGKPGSRSTDDYGDVVGY